ncbi:MAG TPA: hypothetical protein VGI39_09630 [Polyangiaceae bacterium]
MGMGSGCFFTALAGALALASLEACSSEAAPRTGVDPGSPSAGQGSELNPDGVPYPAPSGAYGHLARSGSTPGSVLKNFKFLGHADGSGALSTVALADYYDPCNKRYKILHLSVAAVWCEPCNQETSAVVADRASPEGTLAADKVVFLQALDDGPTEGTPATVSDLDYWIKSHGSNFTEMLDPGLANLGGFFNAASIPWNADIDVRTMEMLTSSEGWAGDVATELAPALAALPNEPSYPIPASAGCPQ